MWVILYLFALLFCLFAVQSAVLAAYRLPLKWTYGAERHHPKSLRLVLKAVLQVTLIGGTLLFPYLVGQTPASYYGPRFRLDHLPYFAWGWLLAVALQLAIYGLETACGWIGWKAHYPPRQTLGKCLRGSLSSLTVVGVEEPFFRGVLLQGLLAATSPLVAIPLGAALFSAAHFIRRARTYWPAVGLAVLGVWLGVAYWKTGSFWLPMGLHSGGIFGIVIQRCYARYKAPLWLVGYDVYPIAGVVSIGVMLVGALLTWLLL